MVYRSPFITETDEPRSTDCQFASGLMLVAEWTAGEAIHDRHGNTLDAKGLKRLRERIRVLSGDTVGGAALEDLARGIARRFPDLPPLPRTTAPVGPTAAVVGRAVGKAPGRPLRGPGWRPHQGIGAQEPAALDAGGGRLRPRRLHPYTARGERAFVMDPLGRGRYQGRWVAKADLRQYASRFTTSSGSPYCAVVKRGQQSSVERVRRQVRERNKDLRTELVTARSAVTAARAQALRDAIRAVAAVPR